MEQTALQVLKDKPARKAQRGQPVLPEQLDRKGHKVNQGRPEEELALFLSLTLPMWQGLERLFLAQVKDKNGCNKLPYANRVTSF